MRVGVRQQGELRGELLPQARILQQEAGRGGAVCVMAAREAVDLLIKVGEYKQGADPLADKEMERHEKINEFLTQKMGVASSMEETLQQLQALVQ